MSCEDRLAVLRVDPSSEIIMPMSTSLLANCSNDAHDVDGRHEDMSSRFCFEREFICVNRIEDLASFIVVTFLIDLKIFSSLECKTSSQISELCSSLNCILISRNCMIHCNRFLDLFSIEIYSDLSSRLLESCSKFDWSILHCRLIKFR